MSRHNEMHILVERMERGMKSRTSITYEMDRTKQTRGPRTRKAPTSQPLRDERQIDGSSRLHANSSDTRINLERQDSGGRVPTQEIRRQRAYHDGASLACIMGGIDIYKVTRSRH